MKQAFMIMQIGNTELDSVYHDVIAPTISKCGLEPKRVDKHNEGGLLKNEIVNFIKSSDIIIADLTNERPNCYLEVGYTMGLNKLPNLILTAREDHHQDSPNFKTDGPRIHFDLSGYDILLWYPDNLAEFKEKLERRINHRLTVPSNNTTLPSTPYAEWISEHSEKLINNVLKLWFENKHELRMVHSDFSIQTPLHNAYYKPLNNSRIEEFAGIYYLDEKKRKQVFEHFQSVEYKDVLNNWLKLEALSNNYLTKTIKIWNQIEEEFSKNAPVEFCLSENISTHSSFYDLGNTVVGIYVSVKELAFRGKYKNPFIKIHENGEFKVYDLSKLYAKSSDEKLIDGFIKVVNEIVKNKTLRKQFKVLDEQYKEIIASERNLNLQLGDIIDDFEDGHINLKGTCSLCKEWVEQLRSFNKGRI